MKKKIAYLSLFLLLLSCFASCRSLKKTTTKADSTVTRSEEMQTNWDRLTVTEIFSGPELTLPDVSLALPKDIYFPFVRSIASPAPEPEIKTVQQPLSSKPGQRLIIRTTTHEKGQVKQAKEEHKQVQVRQLEKETGISTSPWFTVVMVIMILIIVLCLILEKFIKRNL